MRVTCCLIVLLAAALAAAGCAPQPVAVIPAPSAPGIDNMVYGSAAAPAPVSGQGYSAAPTRIAGQLMARAAYGPTVRDDPPYTLDAGDRLRVVVFGQDGLSNSYVVDASGHIAMPLIGSVLARGATTNELSQRIAERLRQGFIRDPHVAVEIEAYRPFFILGEVAAPGQYPYVANMDVETAVAIAGGFGPRAYRRTVIVNRVVNGRQVRMTVPTTYPLRPGDTVNVQERWF
jgi:polysaccharide biosynthesis/export protein